MKSIKELISVEHLNYREPFKESYDEEYTAQIINNLFAIMESNKTAFRVAYQTQEQVDLAKLIWLRAFMDAELHDLDLIEKGMARMFQEENPFAVTVGKFISFCSVSPNDLGWPSIDAAYQEAVNLAHPSSIKNWSHSSIREVMRRIGSFDFTHMNAKDSRKRFEKEYVQLMNEVHSGKPLSPLLAQDPKIAFRLKSHAEKNWEEYRKGGKEVDPPVNGWFNEEAQDKQHDERLARYREIFASRGIGIPDYAHLDSRDKAMPVIMALLEKMEEKQESYKKLMD